MGAADLLVRILRHKAAQRWPGLVPEKPRRGSVGTERPVPGPANTRNEVHGDARGVVVQAGHTVQLHIHHHGSATPRERPGTTTAEPSGNGRT